MQPSICLLATCKKLTLAALAATLPAWVDGASLNEHELPVFLLSSSAHGAAYLAPTMHFGFTQLHRVNEPAVKVSSKSLILEYLPTPNVPRTLQDPKFRLSHEVLTEVAEISAQPLDDALAATGTRGSSGRELIHQLHPYIISAALESGCSDKVVSAASVDGMLLEDATRRTLEVSGLESFEEGLVSVLQINGRDWGYHLRTLAERRIGGTCRFDSFGFLDDLSLKLLKVDLVGMYDAVHSYHRDILGSTVLFDAMFSSERNRSLTEKIVQKLSREGLPLIAVGAGHFEGPHGILKQLCEQDIQVTLISSATATPWCGVTRHGSAPR